MQSGVESSRARLAAFNDSTTRIDIRPEQQAKAGFFGEDGPGFRDVLDAINPLNHIPIVADLLESATGHKVSTASQLIGGTLLGGPIGFMASLAGVIFKDATGKTPTDAVYAALTGDDTTAVASAVAPAEKTQQTAAVESAEPEVMQLASLAPAAAAPVEAVTSQLQAQATTNTALTAKDKAVLDLYGNSARSAHHSYQKAQMLPYLRDVTTSKVL